MPKQKNTRFSRRKFGTACASVMAGVGLGLGCGSGSDKANPDLPQARQPNQNPPLQDGTTKGRYNILLLLTDQERFFANPPMALPGHALLESLGVTFEQHQIAANVCSPSRSVIYTGQLIQHTGVLNDLIATEVGEDDPGALALQLPQYAEWDVTSADV